LVVGVGAIAYITSSVTSVMTAVSIERGIHSLTDLPGKTVGVFTGSVAEDYVTELGIASRSYPDIDAAAEAMKAGNIDAIVGDAPILEHFAHNKPQENVAVVGNIFHPDKYGFAFPHNSELTRPVTLQILQLIETAPSKNCAIGILEAPYDWRRHEKPHSARKSKN
jgi:polar amino acid transport system substrate-binding protein